MPQYFRGLGSALLQYYVQDFDPVRGFIYRAEWAANDAGQAAIVGIANDNAALGIQCSLKYEHGRWTLQAEDSTQSSSIDSWEIVGTEEQVDGFSHPVAVFELGVQDQGCISVIRQHLANEDTPEVAFAAGQTPDVSIFANTFVSAAYSLNQRGSPDFRRGQYVLRHRSNISSRSGANIADIGIDQIYTPAQLLSEVQSGIWAYPLPNALAYEIANIPSYNAAGYLWGWLKSAPTKTTTANNRIEITTEYTLELWSTYYYNAFSG